MTENSLKKKAVNGVLWKIIEQGGNQGINFIVSLVLARLIAPEQFGLIVELNIFIAISRVFIDAGFSSALIRKNDRNQDDCSTVYWFNIIVAIVCYIIIFFIAPFVSLFYEESQLTSILRVSALGIVIGSFGGVHWVLLTANMKFKDITKYNLLGIILSGGIGIILAFNGFEVWALVYQSLTGTLIGTIIIWFKSEWRPSFIFSKKSFHDFFGFGSKLLASNVLETAYNNIYGIVIGKIYKPADLAFYNRSYSLPSLTTVMPTGILQSVTYPTLCKLQDDDNLLKDAYRKMLRVSSFVIFPMCLGLGAVAYPLITVLYTDVWIYSATLLSIIVFGLFLYPIQAINLNYLIVKGRSDLFFRLEIIKKIQGIIILCVTVPFGLEVMCWGGVIGCCLSLIWNTHYTGKFLHMSLISQLRDIFPSLLLGFVMYAGARLCANYLGNNIISLICSILTGIFIYLGGAILFRFQELKELRNLRK